MNDPNSQSSHSRSHELTREYSETQSISESAVAPEIVTVADEPRMVSSSESLVPLLRRRLRFVAAIFVALYGYFAMDSAISIVQGRVTSPSSWTLHTVIWAGLAALLTLGYLVWRTESQSLKRLRLIEVGLVGLVFINLTLADYQILFLYMDWPVFLKRNGDGSLANHSRGLLLSWYVLMSGYAVLIPNTGRRCAWVVGIMAVTPVILTALAGTSWGVIGDGRFIRFYLVHMAIWTAVGAATAAYGAHRIEVMRQAAVEARRLGQYQLKRRLGRGGMGEVYLAEHVLLKQPCAVKLIRPEKTGDPTNFIRFEREVKATARLKHWNTVQIFDYGRAADGTFYYAMEYLPGLSLEELVRRAGPLPPGRAVHLLRQVCAALHEAHTTGLIHRDIKPSNIMICERGGIYDVAKLLDFGLVQAVESNSDVERLTQVGNAPGTPAYMSPEQASGSSLDARSDLYSLGVVAYYVLTGRPPFRRDTHVQIALAHIQAPVPPPTDFRPDLPQDVQEIVLKCLEKEPSRRFSSADALDQALARCSCATTWTRELATDWWSATPIPETPAAT